MLASEVKGEADKMEQIFLLGVTLLMLIQYDTISSKGFNMSQYNYEDRIVLFIDILGFKSIINKTVTDQSENKKIINLINLVGSHLNLNKEYPEYMKSKVVTQFSDCIVVSFKDTEESGIFHLFLDVLHLHIDAMAKGYMIRGAITQGLLYHTEDIIFGPALVKAYELESKVSNFPRVIMEDSLLNTGATNCKKGHTFNMEMEYLKNIVSLDNDGYYFIDYFENAFSEMDEPEYFPDYLDAMRKVITNGLASHNVSLKSKYMWMKLRFNKILSKATSESYINSLKKEGNIELATYYEESKPIS